MCHRTVRVLPRFACEAVDQYLRIEIFGASPVADSLDRSMDDFQQPGRAHAAADTHRDDSIFGLAAASFDQSVAGEASASHAVGMPDGNCSAVDVEVFRSHPDVVRALD